MTTPFGLSQDLARGRIGINSELRVHHVTRTVGRRGYSRLQTEEVMWRRVGWEGAGLWRRVGWEGVGVWRKVEWEGAEMWRRAGYEGGLCDLPLPQVGRSRNPRFGRTEPLQEIHSQK